MSRRNKLPDADYLRSIIDYDPLTGICKWKIRSYDMYKHKGICDRFNKDYAGKEIGQLTPFGYLTIQLKGKNYYLHRIIWKIVTGDDPDTVDHIDGNQINNRFINLRNVNDEVNSKNAKTSIRNKSGCTGVTWHTKYQVWQARININKKNTFIGQYDNLDEAIAARKAAERKHGYHENHGR